jgi:hypothetical protein
MKIKIRFRVALAAMCLLLGIGSLAYYVFGAAYSSAFAGLLNSIGPATQVRSSIFVRMLPYIGFVLVAIGLVIAGNLIFARGSRPKQ